LTTVLQLQNIIKLHRSTKKTCGKKT